MTSDSAAASTAAGLQAVHQQWHKALSFILSSMDVVKRFLSALSTQMLLVTDQDSDSASASPQLVAALNPLRKQFKGTVYRPLPRCAFRL